jgi:hypothetical protein
MHFQLNFLPIPSGHSLQEIKNYLPKAHLDMRRMPKKGRDFYGLENNGDNIVL